MASEPIFSVLRRISRPQGDVRHDHHDFWRRPDHRRHRGRWPRRECRAHDRPAHPRSLPSLPRGHPARRRGGGGDLRRHHSVWRDGGFARSAPSSSSSCKRSRSGITRARPAPAFPKPTCARRCCCAPIRSSRAPRGCGSSIVERYAQPSSTPRRIRTSINAARSVPPAISFRSLTSPARSWVSTRHTLST